MAELVLEMGSAVTERAGEIFEPEVLAFCCEH